MSAESKLNTGNTVDYEKKLNGIILAGGLSSRMGRDKGLLLLDGKTMVEHAYEKLAPVCKRVILVTNKPENYQIIANRLGMTVITDIIKQMGPMSGIHAGLTESDTGYNFIMACDLPNADPGKFIEYAQEAMDQGEYMIVAQAEDGKYHSLHAIYHKQCKDFAERQLKKENLRIKDLFDLLDPYLIPVAEFGEEMFENMNTPDDYDQALRKLHNNL